MGCWHIKIGDVKMPDLKIFASHPVQYHVPFLRQLVQDGVGIEVLYYHQGTAKQVAHDPGFGIQFQWDIDLLTGYKNQFLLNHKATYTIAEQSQSILKLLKWALTDLQTPLLLVGWFAHNVWLVWLLRTLVGVPVFILCETTPETFCALPKPKWRILLLRWLLQHAAACLYIGKRNLEFYKSMHVSDRRLFPTPYSVDNARFEVDFLKYQKERHVLCQKYNLDVALPTFVFCGKFDANKRPLELLNAYWDAGLQDSAQLVFVGDGELRSELEDKIRVMSAKHVHIMGFLNQSEMPKAYVIGEMLCLISSSETWGLVVNEAFACGRPAIVTDTVGCSSDLIIPGETGWITPLDNSQSLNMILRLAYDHYGEWSKMGQQARSRIARHTYKEMVIGIKAALHSVQKKEVSEG